MKNKKAPYLICLILGLMFLNITSLTFAGQKVELTASASSYQGRDAASRAVDGDMDTYWRGRRRNDPWTITVDAGSIISLDKIKIYWDTRDYATGYDIDISADGGYWDNLYTGLNSGGSLKVHTLQKEARYVKITIISVRRSFPKIYEIELYRHKFIPKQMRFQGRLKENTATTQEEGPMDVTLTFSIYDTKTGGSPLWSETYYDVRVEDGIVDVLLGEQDENKINLPFDKQYYIGVTVESDDEMAPRFKLTSVPYSYVAER